MQGSTKMNRLLTAVALAAIAALPVALLADRHDSAGAHPGGEDTYVYREAEALLPALESYASNAQGSATQSAAVRQGNVGEVVWSGQAQVLFDHRSADASRATLAFDVPQDGDYTVAAALTRGPDFGIAQLALDGRRVGGDFDGWAPAVQRADPVELGAVELAAGRHTITLTVPTKRAESGGWNAGLDYLELHGR
jgi:D-arabinan exo alpha-(1,3)/(1,5)-arabinofuranosidase (non-reducing end)